MAEAAIPVDLFNPGQVFACLGFLEAADVLLGGAEGGFDWSNDADVRFVLRAAGDENPVAAVLAFLQAETTTTEWFSPSRDITERDGGKTVFLEGVSLGREVKEADLPGRLVGVFKGIRYEIPFGFWADGTARFHTPFKKSTYSNSAFKRFENALLAIRMLDPDAAIADPFGQAVRTQSLFRLDPRGSTDPLNAGTSPDTLRKGGIDVRVATYPLCEALAVLGLEYARPKVSRDRDGDAFVYRVWASMKSDLDRSPVLLPPHLARAAIGANFPFLAMRQFRVMHKEAKKGGDRMITSIVEELG